MKLSGRRATDHLYPITTPDTLEEINKLLKLDLFEDDGRDIEARYFYDIPSKVARKLLDKKYIDPDERVAEGCPSALSQIRFAENHKNVAETFFSGYVVFTDNEIEVHLDRIVYHIRSSAYYQYNLVAWEFEQFYNRAYCVEHMFARLVAWWDINNEHLKD